MMTTMQTMLVKSLLRDEISRLEATNDGITQKGRKKPIGRELIMYMSNKNLINKYGEILEALSFK